MTATHRHVTTNEHVGAANTLLGELLVPRLELLVGVGLESSTHSSSSLISCQVQQTSAGQSYLSGVSTRAVAHASGVSMHVSLTKRSGSASLKSAATALVQEY